MLVVALRAWWRVVPESDREIARDVVLRRGGRPLALGTLARFAATRQADQAMRNAADGNRDGVGQAAAVKPARLRALAGARGRQPPSSHHDNDHQLQPHAGATLVAGG